MWYASSSFFSSMLVTCINPCFHPSISFYFLIFFIYCFQKRATSNLQIRSNDQMTDKATDHGCQALLHKYVGKENREDEEKEDGKRIIQEKKRSGERI